MPYLKKEIPDYTIHTINVKVFFVLQVWILNHRNAVRSVQMKFGTQVDDTMRRKK